MQLVFSVVFHVLLGIHRVTMTSFAITLYGQCCRPYVVGEQVVSDISVVCSCWSICSLCSEFGSTHLYYACSLMYLERLFSF